MKDKEILLQKLLKLLEKTDSYINEINALKKEIQDIQEVKEEITPEVKTPEPLLPYYKPVILKKEEQQPVKPQAVQQIPTPVVQPKQQPLNIKKAHTAKNVNVEKYIGENLINKIGIGILVLGIAFFVKYAIDKNWINEVARMWIGILCGFILCGLAYWMRTKYKAFSSVLTGGGISVFYFTFFIAFREYAIISQATAFILMIITTAFTVFLSVWYGRRELAIIAIIGGFASPLMVSTGLGNYIVFFTYLFILNVGMMALAYLKKWNEINIISYIFTVMFYGSWLIVRVILKETDPYIGALFFGTLFYLLFFATNIINAFRAERKFGVFEIMMLASNTFLYYVAGMIILNKFYSYNFLGLFTALIGIFNLGFSLVLFRNKSVSSILRYFLVGFGVGFVSLIAPVQLHGNYITLFWAIEFVLLFWLSEKSGLALLKIFSFSVLFVLLWSILLDWVKYYGYQSHVLLPVVFNKAFLTGMFVSASVYVNIFLINYFKQENVLKGFSSKMYRVILDFILTVVLFIVLLLELVNGLNQSGRELSFSNIVVFSYVSAYLLLVFYLFRKKLPEYAIILFCIAVISSHIIYLIASHADNIILRNDYLFTNFAGLGDFLYHYINIAIVITGLIFVKNVIRINSSRSPELYKIYLWYFCFILIFIASSELDHICVLTLSSTLDLSDILKHSHMIGYPIIWGLSSLMIMIYGLRQKDKMLRIISLSIFGIILLKLFLFDIRFISAGGKVAAFIILGIILLLVSFLYQKLKKIVFGEEQETELNQKS